MDHSMIASTAKASPFRTESARFLAGRFGMALFLVSLAMLFAASLVGYLVIRLYAENWPDDLPPLPRTLWISTLILVVSSYTMQQALNAVRRDETARLKRMMLTTTLLAGVFLVLQAYCWTAWFAQLGELWHPPAADEVEQAVHRWALTSFFVLTGLHALHVIGGLAPMILVTARALADRYSAARHHGVHYCMMYWHFLGVVWVILFTTLLIGT
jgi:cytochrome c oxidase subunit III